MSTESCSACNVKIGPDEWFCDHCGEPRNNCPHCGGKITSGQCSSCGSSRQAPCQECGRMISVDTDECPHCSYNPSSTRKNTSIAALAIGAVLGIGIPLGGASMFDGIVGLIVGILLFIVIVPIAMFMTGGGLLGLSSSSGKKPASIEKGKDVYGVDNPRIEIAKEKIPSACPECNRDWDTYKFGNTVEREGYKEMKDDRYQCSVCNHIVRI